MSGTASSGLLGSVLSQVWPVVLLFGIAVLGSAGRQGQAGMMAIGNSRAKVYIEKVLRCGN